MKKRDELPDMCQRCYAEIDLMALRNNLEVMHERISDNTKIVGVIKTNAYGHGSVEFAKVMEELDYCWGYAVATYEEALQLRKEAIKKPILILGYTFLYSYEEMAKYDIRPAVFQKETIDRLNIAAKKAGKKIKVHVKVDTGMGRIGICPNDEGLEFIKYILTKEYVEIEGIFTHFARADETDKQYAIKQKELFSEFVEKVEQTLDIKIPMKHCSNSAGIFELNTANMDAVRAGITLYGLYPSDDIMMDCSGLQPVLSLYASVVYIKNIEKGTTISYGGTFTAKEKMRVATISIGYGDGYPRSLSNKGYVILHGKRARILGRVCMDQMMVDVTDIEAAKEGDFVTLIGEEGNERITAEELGNLAGRFNYEFVCDIGNRVPRFFVNA